ncbi:alpha-L-fucosidase [Pedobacter frigidisoli]|uniref:alpha-L-fucosidase n=1 Tax=Pedobacter frigidisoli TaxID=2530455 RepID=UPI00292E5F17|nr:alpha-L-fucosidase [Pedobacter frigidisoli]
MKRRTLLKNLATIIPSLWLSDAVAKGNIFLNPDGSSAHIRVPFSPTWESLSTYSVPDWYRDAKFGIWAHWGPQCQPERGDWYARGMYEEGSDQYKYHREKYGHPSQFGFKDVINVWKAEKWDPEYLVGLYKKAGAEYFVALANHHDNFDLYDSKYQSWNSVKMGPKKDIVGGWAKAAKKHQINFGVSVHAAHAWSWFETAQRSDKKGDMTGVPYDGKLKKDDGKDKWWNGQDPQELYAQNHPLSENSADNGMIHKQWNWGNGVAEPSVAYNEKFFKRTIDLIDKYHPELIYFDDTALPMWPVSDVGLKIAAHMYNSSVKRTGQLKAVINGKILDEQQRRCMVWDIERGQSNQIEPLPWQTCTCIGSWHYDRRIFENRKYKTAKAVVQTLADVVSKNGNLLLSVPLRGDGSIDSEELAVVEEIGRWMSINKEAIFGTRPWSIFGEGPSTLDLAPLKAQGFNEGKNKPFTSRDVRFTKKGAFLYAIVLGWPEDGKLIIKSLGNSSGISVKKIELLGHAQIDQFKQNNSGLSIDLPGSIPDLSYAYVLKIS